MQRAASEAQAANGALTHVGEPDIASLDEPRAPARICKSRFADVRDAVLREYDWNFASAWIVPARDPVAAAGPLKNRFVLPNDCLFVRSVEGLETDQWAVEASSLQPGDSPILGSVLVTNALAPNVNYTRCVEQPALWDALFLQVFQLRLGAAIAPLLGRSQDLADRLDARADAKLRPAKRKDAQEKARTEVPSETSWIAARRGGIGRPW